jgi:hypothetical protein
MKGYHSTKHLNTYTMRDRVTEYAKVNGLSKKSRDYSRRDEDKWRRYYLFYYLRSKGTSLANIGECFGLDHSTVIHGLKAYHNLCKYDDFRSVINEVEFEFPILEGLYADCKHLRINESLRILQTELNNRLTKKKVRAEVKKSLQH